MRHPHMQIVGLDHINYQHSMEEEAFRGIPIWQNGEVEVNLSTQPRVGFFEFNILLQKEGLLHLLPMEIQAVAHYILNHFHRHCSSYNLFFYENGGASTGENDAAFVLSPVYVGYRFLRFPVRWKGGGICAHPVFCQNDILILLLRRF